MAGKKAETKPADPVEEKAEVKTKTEETTGGGMDDNTLAAVSYVFSWLSGAIVFFIAKDKAKDTEYVQFHAMQSLILGLVSFVLCFVLIGVLVAPFIWLYGLYIAFVYAYKGKKYSIPYIGEYAEKYAKQYAK
ncbi:MAG: DUF4870 domain-containing protein [Candidatus Micrarchaeota archaeon]